MKNLSSLEIYHLFKDFYLKKETISSLCTKYQITRYQFYKLKKSYPKKSFYDYDLQDWVKACKEIDPRGSSVDIRNYLSYVNKTEYTLEEIENIIY